jgi:hypothetical protein
MEIKEYLKKVITKEDYDLWIEPTTEHVIDKKNNNYCSKHLLPK